MHIELCLTTGNNKCDHHKTMAQHKTMFFTRPWFSVVFKRHSKAQARQLGCTYQGAHTFPKTIFYIFSILNEITSIPSLTLTFPTFYSWNTMQKASSKLSSAKFEGSVYFTPKILAASHRLELLCSQSKIRSCGMTQFEEKGQFVRQTACCS